MRSFVPVFYTASQSKNDKGISRKLALCFLVFKGQAHFGLKTSSKGEREVNFKRMLDSRVLLLSMLLLFILHEGHAFKNNLRLLKKIQVHKHTTIIFQYSDWTWHAFTNLKKSVDKDRLKRIERMSMHLFKLPVKDVLE